MTISSSNRNNNEPSKLIHPSKKTTLGRTFHFYQNDNLATQVGTQEPRHTLWANNVALVQHGQRDTAKILEVDQANTVLRIASSAMAYSPYGHIPVKMIEAMIAFNGQWRDTLTLGYALGAGHRTYYPALFRFASADIFSPFKKGGLNAYAYCEGDPINHIDSTGQSRIPWTIKKFFASPQRIARHYEKQRSKIINNGNRLLSHVTTGKKYSETIDYQKADLQPKGLASRYNNSVAMFEQLELAMEINSDKIRKLKLTTAENNFNDDLMEAYDLLEYRDDVLTRLYKQNTTVPVINSVSRYWSVGNQNMNFRSTTPDPNRFLYRSGGY